MDAKKRDEGLAELQGWVGCPGCDFCDESKLGTNEQCKGEGYMTPPYQSPGHMICRHRREVSRATEQAARQ